MRERGALKTISGAVKGPQEGVEAALLHVVEVVARHLADRAQLALVAVALAQQAGNREAAAVAELREVDFYARRAGKPARHRRRIVGRLEPDDLAALRLRRVRDDAPLFDQSFHRQPF